MFVLAHEPIGVEGCLVTVEVDIRRGIPAVDLVGLAETAVKEARERVRAAVRNSGFEFPPDRVLVNLAPAGLRKDGAAYDLPIALAVLGAAGLLPDPSCAVLALGELRLDGTVRPVRAVLPAIAAGLAAGVGAFIVPAANLAEARAQGRGLVYSIERLDEAVDILARMREGRAPEPSPESVKAPVSETAPLADLADIRGLPRLRRALEIAAAGGHNLLLFGPPGSGKTMAARRFSSLLPDLSRDESLEVSSLYSLVGLLGESGALIQWPPFRAPHHSASLEGLVGGGRHLRPGEASMAHRGVLFLDEAPEFHRDALQALREPLEEGRISIVRAGRLAQYPAAFQLLIAANPCPCGNLGRKGHSCLCTPPELDRYWKRLSGPLLDRLDIRIPVRPAGAREILGPPGEPSAVVRARVEAARMRQHERFRALRISRNAALPPGLVEKLCPLSEAARRALEAAVAQLSLSSRACHSVLKVALTITDLEGGSLIGEEALLEAIQHRRYGEEDYYWEKAFF